MVCVLAILIGCVEGKIGTRTEIYGYRHKLNIFPLIVLSKQFDLLQIAKQCLSNCSNAIRRVISHSHIKIFFYFLLTVG